MAGAMVVFRDRREALGILTPDDFYTPAIGQLWGVMQGLHDDGAPIDMVTIGDVYSKNAWQLEPGFLAHLAANTPGYPAQQHIEIILRHSAARRLIKLATESIDELYNRADPYEVMDGIGSSLGSIDVPLMNHKQLARPIEEVIENAEATAPWVIPGLFRKDWRVIVVGGEGHGKSVLSRQIGICASQGIHPFMHRPIPPIRVLIIDLENPDAAVAETGEAMIRQAKIDANGTYDRDRIMYHSRIDGIDLRNRRDRAEIENEIIMQQPDLVIIGPAYLMTPKHVYGGRQENDEDATLPVLLVLNDLRKRYGFALMMEHHAPNGNGPAREMRPMGSSLWRRWSEIGIAMAQVKDSKPAVYNLLRYRGDRLRNQWPTSINVDLTWPWAPNWVGGMPKIEDVDVPLPIPTMPPIIPADTEAF